eukprot:1959844-Rhodomonas_salina.2
MTTVQNTTSGSVIGVMSPYPNVVSVVVDQYRLHSPRTPPSRPHPPSYCSAMDKRVITTSSPKPLGNILVSVVVHVSWVPSSPLYDSPSRKKRHAFRCVTMKTINVNFISRSTLPTPTKHPRYTRCVPRCVPRYVVAIGLPGMDMKPVLYGVQIVLDFADPEQAQNPKHTQLPD